MPLAPFSPEAPHPLPATVQAAVWRATESAPAAATLASGHPVLDAVIGGWPLGQLSEILCAAPGCGELALCLPALARAGDVLWVLPEAGRGPAAARPYAPALVAAGVDLKRLIVVAPDSARNAAWVVEQGLRQGGPRAVIAWLPGLDFAALRRLQLLAARHASLVFALRAADRADAPSPAALRLALLEPSQGDARLRLQVLKRRGAPLAQPLALELPTTAARSVKPPALPAPAPQRRVALARRAA